jgi:tryptophan halogenase
MRIVIVGGGTAGWLSAAFLAKTNNLLKLSGGVAAHDITVVESANIPTIGAGEGSTGLFTDAIFNKLASLGITETDFLYGSDATLKMGIRFKDWDGVGTEFISPIQPTDTCLVNIDLDLLSYVAYGKAHNSSFCGYLMENGLSSYYTNKTKTTGTHSYHFNAHKVGEYLKKVCIKNGVKHIQGEVMRLNRNVFNGNLDSVTLDDGITKIEADLWIDCSGFARVLTKPMGCGWKSYSNSLVTNAAIPFIEKFQTNTDVRLETLSQALPNGWMWKIPTQERYGCGYVYSDNFTTYDNAVEELQKVLGREIEPLRNIKFDAGRLDKVWVKNVIGMGLAGSFLEPLEATSIHTTILQLDILCHHFLYDETQHTLIDTSRDRYNFFIARLIDDFADLIQMHYMTKREDSEFWKYCKHSLEKRDKVKYAIDASKHMCLSYLDFEMYHGSANWGVWCWTMAGLGYLNKDVAERTLKNYCLQSDANQTFNKLNIKNKTRSIPLMSSNEFMKSLWNKTILSSKL